MIFITHLLDLVFDRPACYRAVYSDGKKTYRMRRSYAWNLKKIFGGHLEYDPPERKMSVEND